MIMTLREWLDLLPAKAAKYKDCEIVDWTSISERYALLTLKLPPTEGGTYEELVSMDETVETVGE